MGPLNIAFVVQRYGAEVTGGAEQHCRAVARRLAQQHRVTVLTTCALDHSTWNNHYEPGESTVDNVRVLRFSVSRGRSPDFNRFINGFFDRTHSRQEEITFLEKQGPDCPALLDHLRQCKEDYQVIVFYTYLYSPTVLGLPLVASRAVLVPTAHDEPPIRLAIFHELFSLPRHLLFLTSTEESFVRRLFQNHQIPGSVVGMGIDGPRAEPRPERFRGRFRVSGGFLLYLGRVEAGKGCAEMVDFFVRYKRRRPDGPTLILLGKVDMPIPNRRDIRALGFVEEQDKWDAIAGATLLLAPSPYESLSISLLEAWSQATPVLANGRCAVLEEQCLSGNGGLFYTDYAEFEACLDLLLAHEDLRDTLGGQGRRYVQANYAWDRVVPKWETVLQHVTIPNGETK